jgi:hypothetical protein
MHDGTRKPAILGRSEKSEDLPVDEVKREAV